MSRLREWFGKDDSDPHADKENKHYLRRMMHQLKFELFAKMPISKENQKKIAEIIERATEEIRNLK